MLRHEAGLARLSEQINIEDCYTENIINNTIGKIIEIEELNFPEGNFRYYLYTQREFPALNRVEAGVPRPHSGLHPAGGVQEGGA